MSTSDAGGDTPSVSPPGRAVISRLIATFSGTVGLGVKILLLGVMNALAVWAAAILAGDGKWIAFGVLVASTAAIDAVYMFSRRAIPGKFLVPGTILLLAFQVTPIVYTVNVAFTNYSTGHIATKSEAIGAITQNTLEPPPSGKSYVMAPVRDAGGALVLILRDEETGEAFAGTRKGLEPLPPGAIREQAGAIAAVEGYTLITGSELFTLDREIRSLLVPTEGSAAIRAEGLSTAIELQPTLRYDARANTFIRITNGLVFRDNRHGSFVAANGEELEPGWRTGVGFENFDRILHDPLISRPFLRVLVWTFSFAFLAVGLAFALGLFLAITLDKPGMRFQRFYRSLLIIPYAIPGFLSLLVWSGLLNDDFGVVNRLFHIDVPWLFDPWWAKVSIILVSLWLTFPYFFLVCLGALQSIPAELTEAARVDGGGRLQIFRRVTLPLLMVAVAPLLIASFAFNFNNFNNIYFLTAGGPAATDQSVAGSTDILISYTYKIAFQAGKGQDYGLATSMAIVIFFIVGTISALSFSRTKALENLQ